MTDAMLVAAIAVACNLALAADVIRHRRPYQPSTRRRTAIRRDLQEAARRIQEHR